MRLRGPAIACMLVGLGLAGERARGNGVIVVPVTYTYYVPVTRVVQSAPGTGPTRKGLLRQLFKPGVAPAHKTRIEYQLVKYQTTLVVPNLEARPCFPPPPARAPSPQALPEPSPQSLDGRDYAGSTPAARGHVPTGCGRCWPCCFAGPASTRCTCCVHYNRKPKDYDEAKKLVAAFNAEQLQALPGDHPYVAAAVAAAIEAPDPPPHPEPGPQPTPSPADAGAPPPPPAPSGHH